MIKDEFRHILHNRLLLLSVTVICFIPFLYSIFFLKSVWDPYGSTQNLPVAVVNRDEPVEYQGQIMDVGKQTVKQLKKNHQLKWEFVSAKQAKHGMSHRQYYAVVTIPKDFSKDATTALSKHPRQMKLHYQTNGSLNYIGQVITQMGMTKLNEKIRAQVTNAYATAMFKQLHVVGKGMTTAANGATQIDTGLVTLSDGVNRYVAGVSQVNNGVQTLKVSVTPLASGAQQLAAGSQTLANGIAQYTGGVSLLGSGVNQLMANSGTLNSGANQLSSGLGQLMANSNALNSGANQLTAGLGELSGNSSALRSGSDRLASGAGQLNSTVNSQLGNVDFNGMLGALNQAQDLQQSLGQLQTGLATAKGALTGVQESANKLQQSSKSLSGVANASEQLKGVATNDGEIAGLAQQILSDDKASDTSKQAAQQIISKAGSNVSTIQGLSSTLSQLNSLQSSLSGMQQQLGQLSQMSAVINNADGTIRQANTLLNTLNDYKGTLSAMPSAVNKLKAATNQISAGANTLNSGVSQYTNGVDTAAAGAGTLSAGINRYTAGVAQADSGAGQLASGVQQYTAGVSQLGSGIGQLNANSSALNSGAGQLASALGMLNGQVPALVAGVNQLAAGTQQLQDNSPALVTGIAKLNAGASQLATALDNGAKKVNGIKTTSKTAKMIAEPSAVKHSNYSYVPNYGHALAPYVLSVALYVGALVFNFVYPIRRVADFGKSPAAWWASKVVVGSVVVIVMAVVEDAIMMACGLTVLHVPSFFLTTICFGLASMAIVMFLSMTFDNPGRFFAMVLLMLQLGGSGGTFPMQVTMKFYNVIHWYLPMTYSILGLRDSISGGLGQHYTMFCNLVLIVIAIVFYLLLLLAMTWLQHHHFAGKSELDNNQELLGPEGDDDGMHLQERQPDANRDRGGEQ